MDNKKEAILQSVRDFVKEKLESLSKAAEAVKEEQEKNV